MSGKLHGNYKGSFVEKHNKYKGNAASGNARSVCIDGVEYPSCQAAARYYGICAETVSNRCRKDNYIGWNFVI